MTHRDAAATTRQRLAAALRHDEALSYRARLLAWRRRLGAKWSLVALLVPLCMFAVARFGGRAALVLAVPLAVGLAVSIVPRVLAGTPWRFWNPGTVITALLLGLTASVDTPVYMLVVGAVIAELVAKTSAFGSRRFLFNPAALGRAAIAVLETIDPPVASVDAMTTASPLMVVAGGHSRPEFIEHLLLGLSKGALGETSAGLLALLGVVVLSVVVIKREAALTMIFTAPVLVALCPTTTAVTGHAPWVHDPVVYLTGGSTLMMAFFFATDPATTPNTRLGGVGFGLIAASVGVAGRLYTEIPGCEMWGVLLGNALTPTLDRFAAKLTGPRTAPSLAPRGPDSTPRPTAPSSHPIPELGNVTEAVPPTRRGQRRLPAIDLHTEVRHAGLRGRGGAGFPVADKWARALAHPGPRILVVNAQEGEPDTFKDRTLMRHHADRIIDGARLAAAAIGADQIRIVVEPALTDERRALERAAARQPRRRAHDRDTPTLSITTGAEGYVAGEETALLHQIRTGRAIPQPKPPFPTERGLEGRPTVVHNVETVAWLPTITAIGGAAYAERGRPRLLSISGAVKCPGVYCLGESATIADLIRLAGGTTQRLVGFAVGGPGGGLLPARFATTALESTALRELGVSLGAGSVRAIPLGTCVVDEAIAAARFFARESCRDCTPCRVGTAEQLRALTTARSLPAAETMHVLERIHTALVHASRCGLGKVASVSVRSLVRHWPGALEARLEQRPCPCGSTIHRVAPALEVMS